MKRSKFILCSFILVALAGCSVPRPIDPVGPSQPASNPAGADGELIVYTALENAGQVGTRNPTHSAYTVADPNGKPLQRVDNRTGSFYQDPTVITLAPGKYQVRARATNVGWVTVPVTINRGERTVVDLQSGRR